MPHRRVLVHGAREHGAGALGAGAVAPVSGPISAPVPDGRRPVSSSKAIAPSENTSAGVDQAAPAIAFRRAVRPAHRRADADPLQRLDDAEPGGAGLVGRDEDVARVQGAVTDARRPGPHPSPRPAGR